NAEQLRLQLFGLLSSAGIAPHANLMVGGAGSSISVTPLTSAVAEAASGDGDSRMDPRMDPMMADKLVALEAKMQAQAKAMETLLADKARIEADLLQARAGAAAG